MLYITILLFVKDGKEDIFNKYESLVLPILEKYNGQLLYRIRPGKDQHILTPAEYPYEIHIVSFQTNADFEKYKHDEERQSYAHLFRESVEKTILLEGALAS